MCRAEKSHPLLNPSPTRALFYARSAFSFLRRLARFRLCLLLHIVTDCAWPAVRDEAATEISRVVGRANGQ